MDYIVGSFLLQIHSENNQVADRFNGVSCAAYGEIALRNFNAIFNSRRLVETNSTEDSICDNLSMKWVVSTCLASALVGT